MTYDPSEDVPNKWLIQNNNALLMIARMDEENGNIKSELEQMANLTGKPTGEILKAAQDAGWIEETNIRPEDHARSDRYQLTESGLGIQRILRDTEIDKLHREYMEKKEELEDEMENVRGLLEVELRERAPTPMPKEMLDMLTRIDGLSDEFIYSLSKEDLAGITELDVDETSKEEFLRRIGRD